MVRQLWLGVEREFFFKVFLDYMFGSHLCFLSNSGKWFFFFITFGCWILFVAMISPWINSEELIFIKAMHVLCRKLTGSGNCQIFKTLLFMSCIFLVWKQADLEQVSFSGKSNLTCFEGYTNGRFSGYFSSWVKDTRGPFVTWRGCPLGIPFDMLGWCSGEGEFICIGAKEPLGGRGSRL